MSLIRIYLDEDVRPLLAAVLREPGYDAVSAVELGRLSIPELITSSTRLPTNDPC